MSDTDTLLRRFQNLMDCAVKMVSRDSDCLEFHLESGSIVTLTITTEVLGSGGTVH